MRDAYLCGAKVTGKQCGVGQTLLDDKKYFYIAITIKLVVLSYICDVSGREGDEYKCVGRDVGEA